MNCKKCEDRKKGFQGGDTLIGVTRDKTPPSFIDIKTPNYITHWWNCSNCGSTYVKFKKDEGEKAWQVDNNIGAKRYGTF